MQNENEGGSPEVVGGPAAGQARVSIPLEGEVLVARLLVAIDELRAVHAWWCRFDYGAQQCECRLRTVKAIREEIRASVENFGRAQAEPLDPTATQA